MIYKLQDTTNLIPGFAFRGAIIPNSNGNISVLQAKNISENINFCNLVKTSFSGPFGKYFLLKGDVVITLRGMGLGSFRAAVIRGNVNNVIVASSVLIIRTVNNKYSPEFVAAYLNSGEGQKAILDSVTGSYIKSISRKSFGETELPNLDTESQSLIVDLIKNTQEQTKICERRIQLLKNINNSIFENL